VLIHHASCAQLQELQAQLDERNRRLEHFGAIAAEVREDMAVMERTFQATRDDLMVRIGSPLSIVALLAVSLVPLLGHRVLVACVFVQAVSNISSCLKMPC
jgi:hypothetical protein